VTRNGGLWAQGAGWGKTVSASTRSFTFKKLSSGDYYTFTVAAINRQGTGTPVTTVILVATAPVAPTIGSATAGTTGGPITANATWTYSSGGTYATGYRVRALEMSSSGTVLSTTTSALQDEYARSLAMTLPRPGNYRFTVQAVNAYGVSSQSARSNLVAGR